MIVQMHRTSAHVGPLRRKQLSMKFGAALPTCAEGLGYPLDFTTPDTLASIAERAEALSFYAVMANDHLCTPRSIRDALPHPAAFP